MNLTSLLPKSLIIGLAGISSISSSPVRQGETDDKRPDIIFILTDDQRWDALGFAGNDIIDTPEMDKLAKEGCYFRNAFDCTGHQKNQTAVSETIFTAANCCMVKDCISSFVPSFNASKKT